MYLFQVVEDSRNGKEMMGWLEGKLKESKVETRFLLIESILLFPQVEYTGKIHEIAHVAREQVSQP